MLRKGWRKEAEFCSMSLHTIFILIPIIVSIHVLTYTHNLLITHALLSFPFLPLRVEILQPCKIFMQPEDVQFMFNEMVQRSEQLFFSPLEASDDRLLHLPSFLEALASIVRVMEEVCEQICVPCNLLTHLAC